METLYIGSHSTVQMKDLVDTDTGDPVASATIDFTLYDRDGVEVSGQTWPLSLQPVSPGLFSGTLDATLDLKHNWEYEGYCHTTTNLGVEMVIRCPMIAKDRACCE